MAEETGTSSTPGPLELATGLERMRLGGAAAAAATSERRDAESRDERSRDDSGSESRKKRPGPG
jgi:hypothetical protein